MVQYGRKKRRNVLLSGNAAEKVNNDKSLPIHRSYTAIRAIMTRQIVRVGIIGAGASGLTQLKQLLEAFGRPEVKNRTDLEVVVFDKQAEVGGVWYVSLLPGRSYARRREHMLTCRFADEDEKKQYRICTSTRANGRQPDQTNGDQVYVYPPAGEDPSPMYQGLRTNLPYVSLCH